MPVQMQLPEIKVPVMFKKSVILLYSLLLSWGSVGLTQAQAADAAQDGKQWPMPAKNYAATRFSQESQIDTDNVQQLQVAWTFSTGVLHGHEAAPLVVDDTMYIVTPYPNILYALDLTKPGGPIKWVYKPEPALAAQGVACCDVVNRGAAYADGKVVFNTLDNHTVG